MNIQQLYAVRETVRQGYNLTRAADVLLTTQPSVSKSLSELENELGFLIFERRGKRILALTVPGQQVLQSVERILNELNTLSNLQYNAGTEETGCLTIGTTHTQARYFLPKAIAQFRHQYPKVRLVILQGTPQQVANWVESGTADCGIATEALNRYDALVTIPAYSWQHSIIAPCSHPVFNELNYIINNNNNNNNNNIHNNINVKYLQLLSRYPLITYDRAFAGRSQIDHAFQMHGIQPNIVLEAIDADVIKTYVNLELGVGIVSQIAYNPLIDTALYAQVLDGLFGIHWTKIGLRKGVMLRSYVYSLLHHLVPTLTPAKLEHLLGIY